MKRVSDYGKIRGWPLQLKDLKLTFLGQNGKTIQGMLPKGFIIGQSVKWCQQLLTLGLGVALAQRTLQFFDQVFKTNGILGIVWMTAVCRLIQRQAWAFLSFQKGCQRLE